MKTLIINGLLYDGSGKTPYSSNILIENEKIVAITNEKAISADSIIDADGSIVTPGFIDIHRALRSRCAL